MCTVCGCSHGEVRIDGTAQGAPEHEAHDHAHAHAHPSAHGAGEKVVALRDDPTERTRMVSVERDILEKNDALAQRNRAHFGSHRVLALNLVSSPGAGKTTLLAATLERLLPVARAAVIEGDQETSADADRIRATGAPAIQVNTGRGCHLDAQMVDDAFGRLHFEDGVLFVENVGNLVCPAGFDLGEAHKVVIASVTEGEDKPLKYPNMFAAASLMLVSKTDLLPHLDFDVDALVANARRVNPHIGVIHVSARSGEGLDAWLTWIDGARRMQAAAR